MSVLPDGFQKRSLQTLERAMATNGPERYGLIEEAVQLRRLEEREAEAAQSQLTGRHDGGGA
jgi:hypothetical protein